MNIHEYQAKELMKQYGVATLDGKVAFSGEEAVKAAEELGGKVWVVKAQIHAGGRGKGGGVKVVKSLDDVRKETDAMLGMQLVTHQTGPEGQKVNKVFIEQGCAIARELYLSFLVDRASSRVTIMASTEGGMDIEQVAEKTPEKIIKYDIDPASGISGFHARNVAFGLGLKGDQVKSCVKFVMAMYKAFIELDLSIVEINPLVVTQDDKIVALDCKMNFDPNALYRQPKVVEMRDTAEEDDAERRAHDFDLAYVRLDGNIGCLVNGAGLAMATMDIIKLNGEFPANFLDVGGGADEAKVLNAFSIILSDPNVKGILVNIFGGIMRCDIIANGIVAAAKQIGIEVPLVVRLEGTNVEQGKEILSNSGLNIIAADDLGDAATKVCKATRDHIAKAA